MRNTQIKIIHMKIIYGDDSNFSLKLRSIRLAQVLVILYALVFLVMNILIDDLVAQFIFCAKQ